MENKIASIRLGSEPESAAKRRAEIAERLREVAQQIEATEGMPTACFLHIHWRDQGLTRLERLFEDANWLTIIGAFEYAASTGVHVLMNNERVTETPV